jgi:hypothetical protein
LSGCVGMREAVLAGEREVEVVFVEELVLDGRTREIYVYAWAFANMREITSQIE